MALYYRLGGNKADLPSPASDVSGFMRAVAAGCAAEAKTWSPIRKGMRPWIEIDELRQVATTGGCTFS